MVLTNRNRFLFVP